MYQHSRISITDQSLDDLIYTIQSNDEDRIHGDEKSLRAAIYIGAALNEVKNRKLVPHGKFGAWCEQNFGFQKSQRADYMYIAAHSGQLVDARGWALSADLSFGEKTLAGSLRLLRMWKKSQTEKAPRGHNAKQSLKAKYEALVLEHETLKRLGSQAPTIHEIMLDETETTNMKNLFAVWAAASTDPHEAEIAEVLLLKLAAAHETSIQSLLSIVSLKVPAHRNFGVIEQTTGMKLAA